MGRDIHRFTTGLFTMAVATAGFSSIARGATYDPAQALNTAREGARTMSLPLGREPRPVAGSPAKRPARNAALKAPEPNMPTFAELRKAWNEAAPITPDSVKGTWKHIGRSVAGGAACGANQYDPAGIGYGMDSSITRFRFDWLSVPGSSEKRFSLWMTDLAGFGNNQGPVGLKAPAFAFSQWAYYDDGGRLVQTPHAYYDRTCRIATTGEMVCAVNMVLLRTARWDPEMKACAAKRPAYFEVFVKE